MAKNKSIRFLIFLFFNFLALWIGVILMQNGPKTDWYIQLNKAPWTPPNWVFGTAWSSIMTLFSFYITKLSFKFNFLNKKLVILYGAQWILNVSWNYAFFNKNNILIGLLIIVSLWLLIGYFTFKHLQKLKLYTLLILPYLIWMTIAVSLNAFIFIYN